MFLFESRENSVLWNEKKLPELLGTVASAYWNVAAGCVRVCVCVCVCVCARLCDINMESHKNGSKCS